MPFRVRALIECPQDALFEGHPGLVELAQPGDIGDPVRDPRRHFRQRLELRLVARRGAHHPGKFPHRDRPPGAEVDRPVDTLADHRENRGADVVDVDPVADLLPGTPDDERVLTTAGAGSEGRERVAVRLVFPVAGERTRHGYGQAFRSCSYREHFPGQFRPPVQLVRHAGISQVKVVFGEEARLVLAVRPGTRPGRTGR